ncbi:Cytochrome P450, family 82, subfamily G, polypeptide 1 [Heracleum sosnowskyi]|uniref:Cytochrome P450, family 82, subfamily G, polypeptide 1 n=1 Tax=Heracleum sosnowskyi TaxID=360622 RepID=A0AAD8IIV9_9APIA|nr:Cytochrome P450, family 82, subfamily G, polypeptide 1 [Heracleum sosnowskyi]
MDLSQFLLAFSLFSLFLIAYFHFKRYGANTVHCKAPQLPGALPFIGHLHLLRGQYPLARILGNKADKFGPIFSLRLGHHYGVVISRWEMVKECFTTNDRIFATRPTMSFSKYLGYDSAAFASSPYGPYWRDIRKLVNLELLASHQLQKFKHHQYSELNICIRELYLLCSENASLASNVTISKWIDDFTFNTTLRMVVGKRFDSNSSPEDLQIKEAIKRTLYLGGVFVVSDFVTSLEWLDIGGFLKSMMHTSKEVDTILKKWLEEHVQKRSNCNADVIDTDFMDAMLSIVGLDAKTMGYDRDTIIKATIQVIIMTGSESVSETLTWAVSLLLNNPSSLNLAKDELDRNVGTHRWVEESDTKNLTYLQAIVKETLRLYPPAPISGPREATEDCHIGDYHVPKGTRLVVNTWKLHRDPRIWSEPDEFRPERFLEENKNVNHKGQNFEYIPFSSGRRMCPAVTYGFDMVHFVLARLLQGFNYATLDGEAVDMEEGLGIALPKVKPVEVIITPRLPSELYHQNV